ncbi:hypothetical protein PMAYCL1PPCAC_30796 [Pristionchus mayeri]|uniref:G protein-coupled receptor n=1 Tax=Pristionchus mayeri TaxID=1317129 RepID=A0AAN5IF79_9BILA|nr:hypothetical protein PMAYCL1PPCAC_30796 [Pristionchus mayeri]
MSQPFLVHINSSIISLAPKTFKFIFAVEVGSAIEFDTSRLLLPVILHDSRVLHRNFRICLLSMGIHYTTASAARCVLFHYQINDLPLSQTDILLVASHLARDTMFGYFCAMPSSFAFERFVATRYWKWYETAGLSTLLIIPMVEFNNIVPSLLNSYCWTFGIYGQVLNFAIQIFTICAGLIFFAAVYRSNLRLMNTIPLQIASYSLAHNFQIRENIRTLKLIATFLKSAAALNFVAALLFSIFQYSEDLISELAFAVFDMWIAICALLYVVVLIYSERVFLIEAINLIPSWKMRKILSPEEKQAIEMTSVATVTKAYFEDLRNTWNT